MTNKQALQLAAQLDEIATLLAHRARLIRETVDAAWAAEQQLDIEDVIESKHTTPIEGAGYGRKRWLP